MPSNSIRIEAEKMALKGYRLERSNSFNFASGKAYTSLYAKGAKETATASTKFNGATGKYDIVVAYFDENDGASSFKLKKGNQQIGQWKATSKSGGVAPSAQSLVRRTFSNISLKKGETLQLTGTEDGGEAARIDYIELIPKGGNTPTPPTPPKPPSTPKNAFRVEAENMSLKGYRLERSNSFNFASGKAYTSLYAKGAKETATASTKFSGATGKYDIIVAYFDENDGASTFKLKKGNQQIGQWKATSKSGGVAPSAQSLVRRTFSNVSLKNGENIQLTGTENGGEAARIDYIEFVPKGGTPSKPPGSSGSLAGNNGVLEIMALGDSITRGEDAKTSKNKQNGYRDDLARRLKGAGIKFDFVGSLRNGNGFDNNHEGHGGWKIKQLAGSVNGWLNSYKPEIILLQIGTNDMGFSKVGVKDAIGQLGGLIDKIVSKRPAAQLIVSSIAPTNPSRFNNKSIVSNFKSRVQDFNRRIPGLVNSKASQGKSVSFVNAGGSLNANRDLSGDGFHPNSGGYSRMANSLYGAISKVAKKSTNRSQTLAVSADAPVEQDILGVATGFTSRQANRLKGSSGVDSITGSASNEEFRGLRGNDVLTGGGGKDVFAFGSLNHGVDTITDFGGDDMIKITAKTFGGGLQKGSALSESASANGVLVSGKAPISLGSSANFLYDTSSQTLSFDRDGSGNQFGAVAIAKLNGVTNLNADQLKIV